MQPGDLVIPTRSKFLYDEVPIEVTLGMVIYVDDQVRYDITPLLIMKADGNIGWEFPDHWRVLE